MSDLSPLQASDYLSIFALVVSFFSVWISFRITVFAKELEIRYTKFDSLVIGVLTKKLNVVESIILENADQTASLFRNDITSSYVDISLFMVEAKREYPTINLDKFQEEYSIFTDYLYAHSMEQLNSFHNMFLVHRSRLLGLAYNQAMEEGEHAFKEFIKRYLPKL